MSSNSLRSRRSSIVRDKRVVLSTLGMVAVATVVTLQPIVSNAAAGDPTITCPAVEPALANVNIPASAKAEVDQNLALLQKQIDEANARLVSSKGQGGANFVQNAILGPLKDKRVATLNRIAIAIDRRGTRPEGLDALAPCSLTQGADTGGNQSANTGGNQATDTGGNQATNTGGDQGGGVGAEPAPAQGTDPAETNTPAVVVNPTSTEQPVGQQAADGAVAPAADEILGNDCSNSRLQLHTGFQEGNRCVATAFGEVGEQDRNPTLLIASAPQVVRANKAFDLRVSTRNLVRDRFLAAAKGGYYKESSFLNGDGLVRGHFHTACRILGSRRNAPDSAPAPAFFAATEDGAGGAQPDTVTVRVTGLPAGLAQCAVWAGDGSHRIPMMQRANQIPAFDVVRVLVR